MCVTPMTMTVSLWVGVMKQLRGGPRVPYAIAPD
jgi:hypothetical protein